MLHAWYDASLYPSWDIITWALDQMGQNRLAESIREKYTHTELQKLSDENTDTCNKVDLSGKYEEEMIEIERKYILLTEEVYMMCKEINLERVKVWLTQIPVNLIYKHKHLLEGKHIQLVARAESLLELFGYLRSYWNFIDYGLLEYMAVSFGNNEVKHSMRRYVHELTKFRKAVPLSEFMKLWPDRMDPPPEFSRVMTKLDATQSCLTLQDIEEIRLSFARNYSLVTFALMYGSFQIGSVVLMWFTPSSIVPQLVQDLRMGGSGFFKEHSITELNIDGHTVAIVDSNRMIWNLNPNITLTTAAQVGFWNSRYSYFLQPGENVTLSCSKTCDRASPPIWYHSLSKDPWLPMSLIAAGPDLELSLHQPPVPTDVGYFCCACNRDHPKMDATCFGVAYMPHVAHFSITWKGKAVLGVHVGDPIRVKCSVYGFPSHLDIDRHSKLLQYTEVSFSWYSKMWYIEIPHATTNHSGIYTCAALVRAFPDLYLMTENVKRSVVVYTPPNITGMRRWNQNEQKMLNYTLDSDVIICNVASSVHFNVTWLFNGNLMDYGTSKCIYTSHRDEFTCTLQVSQKSKGHYECVVSTAYRIREISQKVSQHEMWIVVIINKMGKLMISLMTSAMVSCVLSFMLSSLMKSWMKTRMETLMLSSVEMSTLIGTLIGTLTGILVGTLAGTLIGTLWGTLMGILIVPLMTTLKPWGIKCRGHFRNRTRYSVISRSFTAKESGSRDSQTGTTEYSMTKDKAYTPQFEHLGQDIPEAYYTLMPEALQTTESTMTKEALQTSTKSLISTEPLQNTELPTIMATLQATELPMTEKVVQTSELPMTEKVVQTPELPVTEKVVQTPELPVTEKVVQTPELPVTEKSLQTPELSMTEKVLQTPELTRTEKSLQTITAPWLSMTEDIVQITELPMTKGHPTSNSPSVLPPKPIEYIPKIAMPVITIEVSHPSGIAVNERREIVVTERNCISIFTCSGQKIRSFSSRGHPRGVAFDSADNILVTDIWSHSIEKFTLEGKLLTAVGRKGSKSLEFNYPTGIGINHKNKKVYICDFVNHRIQVLNEDLTFFSSFGSKGSGDGQLNYPWDVAFDSARSTYIADSLNHCVQVFTPEGWFLRKFGKKGSGKGELNHPSSITIDSDNIVYVTEASNDRVSIFSWQGKFLQAFKGKFCQPHGITVNRSGLVYVTDTINSQVQGFKDLLRSS